MNFKFFSDLLEYRAGVSEKFRKRARERGNVLFLILIAVALFAALSYAVTQSTRSGGGDASKETNKISSAQLTQYPAGVRTSLIRMIVGGSDVATLEFNDPTDFANCSSGFDRCVFHPQGGGATYMTAPGDLIDSASGFSGTWIYNASNEIENIGTTTAGALAGGAGSATADLIAFLPGVAKSVCDSVNTELGLTTTVGDITEDSILYTSASRMINPNGGTPTSIAGDGASIGVTSAALLGQPFGCFYDSNGNADNAAVATYVYYHVLIER